jgi:glycosyltransferase involved in cell wall biosynthesis
VKILHINQSDHIGGAAVAAVRLLDALRSSGTDARMLVLQAKGPHEGIHGLINSGKERFIRNLKFLAEVLSFFPYEKNRQSRFAFSSGRMGYDISRHPLVKEADILHLHWINQGYLSLKDLGKLLKAGKPIVWTLHDTWPITGGCHYPGTCNGFKSTCGQCPLLKTPGKNDISAKQFMRKEKMYADTSITFVGCSNWMRETAQKSSFVRKGLKHSVKHVFNPVDINLFQPVEKSGVRQKLGLPGQKNLLLFGAANIADPRKGTNFLIKALRNLGVCYPALKDKLELMAFGKNIDAFKDQLPFRLHSFDIVQSEETMATLYQAADAFVLPSMQDNLPNTVVESLSCGTPVVAFGTGGVPEMISHQKTGFLAAPGKWMDLADGIRTVLDDNIKFGENARIFAKTHFAPEVIARQYEEIYQSLS